MSVDIFATNTDVEVQEEKDTLGGFRPWESNLYRAVCKSAFLKKAESGSVMLNVNFEMTDADGNKREHTERECVWSAKTQGDFYIDKKDGNKKKQLIGKTKMDGLAKLLTGKSLQELSNSGGIEQKFHKVREDQKEVNKEFPTFVDFAGVELHIGLIKQVVNKQTKQGDRYVDTNETREENFADKYFDADKRTRLEAEAGKDAEFAQTWLEANEGKTRDRSKKVAGAAAGAPTPNAAPTSTLDLGD